MGGGKGGAQVEITEYYMSIHYGICVAADRITRIIIKEKEAWRGSSSLLTEIVIDKEELFGGEKKEGGAVGLCVFLPGASDQILPDYLAQRLGRSGGVDCPGYRGIASAFFVGAGKSKVVGRGGGFYWSANVPYLPGTWFTVERASVGLDPAKALIGEATAGSSWLHFIVDDRLVTEGSPDSIQVALLAALDLVSEAIALGGDVRVHMWQLSGAYGHAGVATGTSATESNIDDLRDWVNGLTFVAGSANYRDTFVSPAVGGPVQAWRNLSSLYDRDVRAQFTISDGTKDDINDAIFNLEDILERGKNPGDVTDVMNEEDGTAVDCYSYSTTQSGLTAMTRFSNMGEARLIGPDLHTIFLNDVARSLGLDGLFDSNPAHIIYECLTNTDWGMGSPSTAIDVDNFEEVAATLYDEQFGLSMIWTRQALIEKFIGEVLDHIQAALFVDPATGLLTLKLIRGDYDVEDLPELTPSNADLSNFGRKLWGEIVNEITVSWTNPATEQSETITVQDLASIVTQGGIVSDSRNYYGVRNATLASQLAARDLRASGAPLAACEAEVDRSKWTLRPASVVKLTWPEYGLDGVVMRVTNIGYGRPGDAKIRLSMIEDVFGLDSGDYVAPPSTSWEDPAVPPTPTDEEQIFTLPLFFAQRASSTASSAVYPEVLAGVLATTNETDTSTIELWDEVAQPDGSLVWQRLNTLNIIGRGTLVNDEIAEAVTVIETLDDYVGNTEPIMGGFAIIGDGAEDDVEIALITSTGETFTLNRGVLDTVPRAWPAGTPVWIIEASSTIADPTTRAAGEEVSYKLLPRTSQGLLPIASAPLISETLTERPWLPLRPANVEAYGEGFSTLGDPIDATERTDPWITTTWSNRNRLLEDGQVLSWTDSTVSPEDGQTTTITVIDDDENVLTVHDGLTGTTFDVPDASFDGAQLIGLRFSSERTDDDGTFESLQSHVIWLQVAAERLTEEGDGRMTEEDDARAREG